MIGLVFGGIVAIFRCNAQIAAPASLSPSLIQYSVSTGAGYSQSRLILYNADNTFVEINSYNTSILFGTESQTTYTGTFSYSIDPSNSAHATVVYSSGGGTTLANDDLYFTSLDSGTQTPPMPGQGSPPGITAPAFTWSPFQSTNGGANVSNRCILTLGTDAITGFVVQSEGPRWVLLRAAGSTLKTFGLANVVSNPSFTVFDAAGGIVGSSSIWSSDPNLTRGYSTIFAAAGAFLLANGSDEGVLLMQLSPGAYTAEFGASTAGAILCEVYILPF
jgi:hypothetical protein